MLRPRRLDYAPSKKPGCNGAHYSGLWSLRCWSETGFYPPDGDMVHCNQSINDADLIYRTVLNYQLETELRKDRSAVLRSRSNLDRLRFFWPAPAPSVSLGQTEHCHRKIWAAFSVPVQGKIKLNQNG